MLRWPHSAHIHEGPVAWGRKAAQRTGHWRHAPSFPSTSRQWCAPPLRSLSITAGAVILSRSGACAVEGGVLVMEPTLPLRSLADLYPNTTERADSDIDPAAARVVADWFAYCDGLLRRLEPDVEITLWPEHFDIACVIGEANYGGSPGDDGHDETEPASKHGCLSLTGYSTSWKRMTRLQNAAPFGTGLRSRSSTCSRMAFTWIVANRFKFQLMPRVSAFSPAG